MALAALTVTSCSSDDDNGGMNPQNGNSYISISIKAPSSSETKAENDTDATASELKVTRAIYYGFNAAGVCLNAGAVPGLANVAGDNDTPSTSGNIVVSSKVRKIFVVVNPTNALFDGTGSMTASGKTFDDLNAAIEGIMSLDEYASTTDVMMTNSENLVDVVPAALESVTATSVTVDRVVSKVALATSTPTTGTGVKVTIAGFSLNTTNKSLYPYAEYITYGSNKTESYREDPNFGKLVLAANGTGTAKDAFNWTNNTNGATFDTADKYCLENTVSAEATDNNNITSMLIKATYFPATFTDGESWFMYQDVPYTFATLKTKYGTLDATDKTAFDTFTSNLLPATKTLADYTNLADFEAALNEKTSYDFAKTTGAVLRYFNKGVCYYSVPIKHDGNVTGDNALGKFGVVRNNLYTLTVTKIMNPGLPFIPDPTDPSITDPENPDPVNPETPDAVDVNIEVSITMNKWSGWAQDVEL